MSVLAVRVLEDSIEIASDSLVTYGMRVQSEIEDCKLFKISDNFIIGGVGYLRDLSLMKMFATDSKPSDNSYKSIFLYVSDYISYIKKHYDEYSPEDSIYYVIYDGKCYRIDGGYDIQEVTDIDSIGSGYESANAILLYGGNVVDAVKIACQVNPYCGGDIFKYEVKRKI
jgi:hypothetical protein